MPDPAPSGDEESHEVFDAEHRALTTGLLLTVSFAAFEALAVTTVLPVTVTDIGGLEYYGWAFSSFMLANLVGVSFAGQAADRHGPALPFAASVVAFLVGLAIAGVAPSMAVLIASRAIQGLGGGGISSMAYVAISRGYSDAARPRMIALMSTAWVIPGLLGPALAGWMAETIGWRSVFVALIPPTIFGAGIAYPALRRLTPTDDGEVQDQRSAAVALMVGAALFLAGLDRSDGWLVVPMVLAGGAVILKALGRLLPAGTLTARAGVPAAIAVNGLLGFAFFGAESFLPLALTELRGQPASLAGLPLTIASIAWTVGAWLQERQAGYRSRRALTMSGFCLIAIGIAGIAAVLSPAVPVWWAGVAWAVASLGIGISHSTLALVTLEWAPQGLEGETSAAMLVSHNLGIAIGTGVGGAALATTTRLGGTLGSGIGIVDGITLVVALGAVAVARGVPPLPRGGRDTSSPAPAPV